MYYNKFIKYYLIDVQNSLLKLPNDNRKEYINSLKEIWEYSRGFKVNQPLPLNFQQACFFLEVLERDFPENNVEIKQYKHLYLETNRDMVKMLGTSNILYQVIYIQLLNIISDSNNEITKKTGVSFSTIKTSLEQENEILSQLINENSNSVFSQLHYIIFTRLPTIIKYSREIEQYYNKDQWRNKSRIIVHKESELNHLKKLIIEVQQTLDTGFKYYQEVILPYEQDNPSLVNNYRKTLHVCYEIFTENLVTYLKILGKILEKENSICTFDIYKNREKIDIISSHLFALAKEIKTNSSYLKNLLTTDVLQLLNDIEKSQFPNTAYCNQNAEIELRNTEKTKQKNMHTHNLWTAILKVINSEYQKITNNIKTLLHTIEIAESNAELVKQELLKESKKDELKKAESQKPRLPNNSHPIKTNNAQKKNPAPKKHNSPSYPLKKPVKNEKIEPLTNGWQAYYTAGKKLDINFDFAIGQYETALKFADEESDHLLKAACYQELAHTYHNKAIDPLKNMDCMQLFAFSKNFITSKEQKINFEDLDAFSKHFFDNFDQRHKQICSFMIVCKYFDQALSYINDAKKAITNLKNLTPKNMHMLEQIKSGIEINEGILQTAQDIIFNFNNLFHILSTHREYVKKILGPEWRNKLPEAQKSPKAIIYQEVSQATQLYAELLRNHQSPIIPGSELMQL